MILMDTDTFTFYSIGHAKVVAKAQAANELPVTSVISRIEVLQGRFASVLKAADGDELVKAQQRLVVAEQSLAKITIVPIDTAAADEFERLRQEKKLKKIGRADLLIACIALAHRVTLVTRNLRHFQLVPGLRLENWAD
jgi:tRNA(fMet)-specific endonuclease VapC